MYDFIYHRACNVEDAVSKMSHLTDSRFLAGGHTILPTMKLRLAQPSDLIDLQSIPDLKGIFVEKEVISIKSMTTHAAVATSTEINRLVPALSLLAAGIGDPHVRARGTIGGSIANNDPAADYPAAVVGLGATVKTNKRAIPGDEFFTSMFETKLDQEELITEINFPIPKKASYYKFKNPASRYAIVGVLVAKTSEGIRVAVTGAGPCVFRIPEMELALSKDFSAEAIRDIQISEIGLNSDIHAQSDYRAHLVNVCARRAVNSCGN